MSIYEGQEKYIFVSYSHRDLRSVSIFLSLLDENHFRYWYDEEIKSGVAWAEYLCNKIKGCSQFVVFISTNAANSNNVKDEVHIAHKYNKEILTVFLEETELDGELELYLDRNQAIHAYGVTKRFREKFLSSLIEACIEKPYTDDILADSDVESNSLSRFTILEEIATKGLKSVYKAFDAHTGHEVVLKQVILDGSFVSAEAARRIRLERNVLNHQSCPFFPEILDYYETNHSICLFEPYIQGSALSSDRSLSLAETVAIVLSVAHSLTYLHKSGYIHCDITPNNIIVNDLFDTILVDFDSCQQIGHPIDNIYGTKGFVAPEMYGFVAPDVYRGLVARNAKEGPAAAVSSDIYGLGMTMYYLLTKDYPESVKDIKKNRWGQYVRDETRTIWLEEEEMKHPNYYCFLDGDKIPALTDIDPKKFDIELDRILHRMIACNLKERYSDLDSLENDLSSYFTGKLDISHIPPKRIIGRIALAVSGKNTEKV